MNLEPWPHIIINDFYDYKLFESMRTELKQYAMDNVRKQQVIVTDLSSLPNTLVCIASRPITDDYIKLFPEHRSYDKLVPKHEISFCVGDFEYPIHDEWSEKILSAVTYIFPDTGIGTILYDINKQYHYTADWKPNSTLIFPGITNKTWHNYKSTAGSIRITQNTFLMRA
jgi:hypothetical protein